MRADSPEVFASSTFAITMGSVPAVLGLLFICIPAPQAGSAARSFSQDSRLNVLKHFIFPVCIWILSARLLGTFEDSLSLFLQNRVVGFVSLVFDLAGATLIREGNVLVLPSGRVGVAEACSGIRSLTGCLSPGIAGRHFFRVLLRKSSCSWLLCFWLFLQIFPEISF